jgi:hypothetical protein
MICVEFRCSLGQIEAGGPTDASYKAAQRTTDIGIMDITCLTT